MVVGWRLLLIREVRPRAAVPVSAMRKQCYFQNASVADVRGFRAFLGKACILWLHKPQLARQRQVALDVDPAKHFGAAPNEHATGNVQ